MNLRRVRAVVTREWREIVRDRVIVLLAFLLAPLLMLVLGYGLSRDVEHVPFALVDHDRSATSRDYTARFVASRSFDFRGQLTDEREADRLLVDGVVRVVLVVPPRFEEVLRAGRPVEVQALIDGTFTPTARTVGAYIEAINAAVSRELQARHLAQRRGLTPERAESMLTPVPVEVRYLYNQRVRVIAGLAPSLVMFVLTLVTPLLMALNVVREKESGAIYNVYASTITRAEFLAGKLVPNVAIGTVNALVLWAVATVVFDVPFKGAAAPFLAATVAYVLTASSAGLLTSLLVRSQQAALVITVILTTIVAVQFSGMLTPVSSMTGLTRALAEILPAAHFNTLAQAAFLKGAGLTETWRPLAVFGAHTAALLLAAWLLFHKRVAE